MLSLDKGPGAIELAMLYDGNSEDHTPKMEGKPLYWLPRRNKKYRMSVEDAPSYLKSDDFRIRYKLSKEDHSALQECLLKDDCPAEGALVKRFYNIREDLENRLYSEMELGENQYLRVDLPRDKKVFSNHWVVIGSSNSGKSYWASEQALQSLRGPPAGRRPIVWASTELNDDATIKRLLAGGLKKWVHGIDTSQEAFDNWKDDDNAGGVQEWYDKEIKPHLIPEKYGHCYLDDSPDSPAYKQLMHFQNKAYRTLRHKKVGLTSLQHSIRGNQYTSQAFSSVFGVVTFPRGGGRGKLIRFLADDIGFGVRKARELVASFSDGGRWLLIRMHAPGCLIGPRNAILT